jgi:hypothetical protein
VAVELPAAGRSGRAWRIHARERRRGSAAHDRHRSAHAARGSKGRRVSCRPPPNPRQRPEHHAEPTAAFVGAGVPGRTPEATGLSSRRRAGRGLDDEVGRAARAAEQALGSWGAVAALRAAAARLVERGADARRRRRHRAAPAGRGCACTSAHRVCLARARSRGGLAAAARSADPADARESPHGAPVAAVASSSGRLSAGPSVVPPTARPRHGAGEERPLALGDDEPRLDGRRVRVGALSPSLA